MTENHRSMFSYSFERRFTVAGMVFIASGITALVLQLPSLLFIPLAWLVAPIIYKTIVHKTRWLFFLLIPALVLSTEINFSNSLGLDFPDELVMMLLSGLFILKLVYKPAVLNKAFYNHPLILLLTLHVCWIFIACIFSQDFLLSIKFFLAKIWFVVPFVVLPSFFLISKKAIRLFALLLVIPMLFVVVQTLLRHALYGFSFEGIKDTVSPFFRNHVNYSAMLVCLLAVGWSMYVLTPKENKYRKVLMISLLIGVAAVILAYSRGAWVALIAGIIAYHAIRKKVIGWLIASAIFILIATAGWLVRENYYLQLAPNFNETIFHKELGEHLKATVQFKDVSNAERFYRWIAGINMVIDRPVTGFGPNNFYHYYKPYTILPFKTWVSNNPDHSTVHNYFLLTALEQGVPGLIIFCVMFFAMIAYSQKLYASLKDRFYKQVALTIGTVLIMIGCLVFMSDLIETDKIGSLFWLCLGLLVVLSGKKHEEKIETHRDNRDIEHIARACPLH